MGHNMGNLSPFTLSEKSKAERIVLSVSDPSCNLVSLCSSVAFCSQEAKIIPFIWSWDNDFIRKN